jgi:hypothetical protein
VQETTTGIMGLFSGMGCLFSPFVLAAILFPVFMQAKTAAVKTQCLSNTKQLALSTLMYASDWDDRLPAASAWQSRTYPYTKSEQVYSCPQAVKDGQQFGYAFSKAVSGANTAMITNPAAENLLFESTKLKRNAYGGLDLLPHPGRHEGSNTHAYADGHARTLKE